MSLPVRQQVKYWGIATAVFLLIMWYLGDIMLPFVLGGAIAYFLDPVADRLEDRLGGAKLTNQREAGEEEMRWPRAVATAIITVVTILAFIMVALLIIPALIAQGIALANNAPQILGQLQNFLAGRFPLVMDEEFLRQLLDRLAMFIQAKAGTFLAGLLNSALGIVNAVVILVVTPVVAFYLLLDWNRIVKRMDELLPRDHASTVSDLAGDIDRTLASFVRGQATVCLILGAFYALSLMLIGLDYGMVVGFTAGFLTFIPYVGAMVGGALAIGLALFEFWGQWWTVAVVAGIFAIGQVIEGNVLTPKLVGSSVGLHPVSIIFALTAFGYLFGFVGMLVAVPVAAVLGVLIRFFIVQYQQGRLYHGTAENDRE